MGRGGHFSVMRSPGLGWRSTHRAQERGLERGEGREGHRHSCAPPPRRKQQAVAARGHRHRRLMEKHRDAAGPSLGTFRAGALDGTDRRRQQLKGHQAHRQTDGHARIPRGAPDSPAGWGSLVLHGCSLVLAGRLALAGAAPGTPARAFPLPVAPDAVGVAAALVVFILALRRAFAEGPWLLVDAAAFGRPPAQVLIVHRVAGPLHLLVRLPLPQLDGQAAVLLPRGTGVGVGVERGGREGGGGDQTPAGSSYGERTWMVWQRDLGWGGGCCVVGGSVGGALPWQLSNSFHEAPRCPAPHCVPSNTTWGTMLDFPGTTPCHGTHTLRSPRLPCPVPVAGVASFHGCQDPLRPLPFGH